MSTSFCLDTEQIANSLRYALIKINDETVIGEEDRRAEDYEFVNYKVAHKIQDSLAGSDVSKITISDLVASSEVISQILKIFDDLEYVEEGLQKLIFHNWSGMKERIADGSILQIAEKCKNLQTL